jgi:hypothetical protein
MCEPVWVMRLQISSNALGTKTTLVDGKIVARFKPDKMTIRYEKIHTALHTAIRTVSGDNLVDHTVSLPPLIRRVMKVRAEFLDHLV